MSYDLKKGNKRKNGCLIISLVALLVSIIVVMQILKFINIMFSEPPDKEEVKNTFFKNKKLFIEVVECIKKLDKDIYVIDNTKFSRSLNLKGLYAKVHIDNGYKEVPFKNKVIEDFFRQVKIIRKIEIHDYCIDFYCGGAGRNFGCSIIWSSDNKHFIWAGSETEEIIRGSSYEWKEEKGDNRRYIKKIIDNWYYYEESF